MKSLKYIFLFSIVVGMLSCNCEEDNVLVDVFEPLAPTPVRVVSPDFGADDSEDYTREINLLSPFENMRYFKIPITFDQPVDTSTVNYGETLSLKDNNGSLLPFVDFAWNANKDELTILLPELALVTNQLDCFSSNVVACPVSLVITDGVRGQNALNLDGDGDGVELGDFEANYLLKTPPIITFPTYASTDTIVVNGGDILNSDIIFDQSMDDVSFTFGNTITFQKIEPNVEEVEIILSWDDEFRALTFLTELEMGGICPEFNCRFELRIKGINSNEDYVKGQNGLGIDGGDSRSYNPDDDFIYFIFASAG